MKNVPERFVKDCITLAYKRTSFGESLASVISSLIYDVYAMGATIGAAAEREACAKVAEEMGNTEANMNKTWRNGCFDVANEIRARGKK